MSGAQSFLTGALLLGLLAASSTADSSGAHSPRLLFTGDILLSRQVQAEIERTGRFPWEGLQELFSKADWVGGNLEGAVGGPRDCLPAPAAQPCFAIPAGFIALLRQAGFQAMGVANNHSGDLGQTGRDATQNELLRQGVCALSFENSPTFLRHGETTIAMVAFSAVPGRDGQRVALPSPVLRQKLRLARTLANLVIVYVHWGSELLDWPDDSQQRSAGWLIRQGADVIIGHHPHVVQPPDCVLGKPVFYSLGNHLFDQKYPASKAGLIADCSIVDGAVACAGIMTQTPAGSAFPQVKAAGGQSEHEDKTRVLAAGCRPRLSSGLIVNGITLRPLIHDGQGSSGELVLEARRAGQLLWTTGPRQLLSIETARMAGPQRPELLFTLERHPSPLDHEQGLRPYVYEVGARGLTARWRGTALAWPLLDAALLPDGNGLLCALHRGDSFLVPEPHTPHARLAMYRWNGFGFSGVDDAGLLQRCQEIIGSAD